jgi:hypothetical protein
MAFILRVLDLNLCQHDCENFKQYTFVPVASTCLVLTGYAPQSWPRSVADQHVWRCSRFRQVFMLAQHTHSVQLLGVLPRMQHTSSTSLITAIARVLLRVYFSHCFCSILIQEWCNIFHNLLPITSNACGGCR